MEADMDRFDGTAARQLVLVEEGETPIVRRQSAPRLRPRPRLLVKDLYRELDLRRRRAQIAARHWVRE
jgi:hypothetical protein